MKRNTQTMEPHGTQSNVFVFDTPEQLALAAAERFVERAYEFHDELDRFSVALAGGKTPRRVYELLATERFKSRVEWSQVHLFFGDERCVPPDHPDSNYAMAYETLISKVAIPANNVRRIIGEGKPDAPTLLNSTPFSSVDYENAATGKVAAFRRWERSAPTDCLLAFFY